MTKAYTVPSIDEYLHERLMPVEGAIPHIPGMEMFGNSIPAGTAGGDLFEYINFQQRYDLDARIQRAQRLAKEFLEPLPRLLGGIASSTFHAWKAEPAKQWLTQNTLLRISLVIGIYKALQIYFGPPWADRWITLGNRGSLFAGVASIDYMIQQGQPGMLQVRRMLDTWHGGR
jgi:hypothetical protein